MKVELECGRVGNRMNQIPGQVVEVEAAEGRRLVDRGQAKLVETHSIGPSETRTRNQRGAK